VLLKKQIQTVFIQDLTALTGLLVSLVKSETVFLRLWIPVGKEEVLPDLQLGRGSSVLRRRFSAQQELPKLVHTLALIVENVKPVIVGTYQEPP
tara:strand:- start:218 stop:499 length:282 start_codon:yes stop_codon:yes gene_type:complete